MRYQSRMINGARQDGHQVEPPFYVMDITGVHKTQSGIERDLASTG